MLKYHQNISPWFESPFEIMSSEIWMVVTLKCHFDPSPDADEVVGVEGVSFCKDCISLELLDHWELVMFSDR